MELKIVKEDEHSILVELPGQTVSFANLLRAELWKDKTVTEAAFIKEHPYLSQPKIFVRTDKGSPKVALEKAAAGIVEQAKELKEELKKTSK
jgi:DNA-directed RNA polymerase subunit L